MMIIEMVLACIILLFILYAVYDSSVELSERSMLRNITGAYYDFEIDEQLKKMKLTREEALAQYRARK